MFAKQSAFPFDKPENKSARRCFATKTAAATGYFASPTAVSNAKSGRHVSP